jgi:transcriptional regulator with XRE-family HTH domain
MAALAASLDLHSARFSAKSAGEYSFRFRSKPVTHVRSFAPNTGGGDTSVSQHDCFGTISERTKRALERRLRPHTTLSAYELAYTLRISESTIWSILSGNSKSGPSGRVLQLLVDFFGASFLQEVFGGPNVHCIDPRDAQKAAALRKLIEAQEELRSLG